ncbi:MAG: lysine biosynthesis protein LysW [Acidobacteriota bacterium]
MGTCPECEENIDLEEDAEVGHIFDCPHCEVSLEILDLYPVLFDFAAKQKISP